MSSVSGSSSAKVKVDPAVFAEVKEEEKEESSRKERIQKAVENAVPSVQEGIKSSTSGSIGVFGAVGQIALNTYAPDSKEISKPLVDAAVEVLTEQKEKSIDPLTDRSVEKTADLVNKSIGKSG